MQSNYVLEVEDRVIVPSMSDHITFDSMCAWASAYPNLYTVYTVGWIKYYDQAALDWFILRWGAPSVSSVSNVGFG